MILPKFTDALHRAWLYRILSALADDVFLASVLRFKGGTCAAMRGILDRFSIDLDFDLIDPDQMKKVCSHLEKIFSKLGLRIDDKSQKAPQYFLKYENKENDRNTIEFDVSFPVPKNNNYEPVRFIDIDRILYCQTPATMFANKLVAVIERFHDHGSIAGRDIFDLHVFFLNGFSYKSEIIQERTGKSADEFLKVLRDFIEKRVTQTVIDQDLNHLLTPGHFHKVRKILKQEILMFLSAGGKS